MTHRATLRLHFDSPEQAARLAASLAPENGSFVTTRIEGNALVAEASAPTPLGLLRTLDEVIVVLAAAQKADQAGASAPAK